MNTIDTKMLDCGLLEFKAAAVKQSRTLDCCLLELKEASLLELEAAAGKQAKAKHASKKRLLLLPLMWRRYMVRL